jgi:hypothetical protein
VTFPVTVLSPPILYNRWEAGAGEERKDPAWLSEEAVTNGKIAGNRDRRLAIALVVVVAVALLATTFRVHTQTSFSTGSGPAGSAAYRQEIAFVRCMRGHGLPSLPDPPPGGSISVQLTGNGAGERSSDPASQAFDACKQLAPRGRDDTNIQITL